jgi:hypothetical protein
LFLPSFHPEKLFHYTLCSFQRTFCSFSLISLIK